MGGYTQFKNITLCSFNLSTRVFDDVYPDYVLGTVNIPVSTGMEALWNKYKNYTISNKLVVGTWNYVGNQPQFTLNDTWFAIMRECGVRMSSLYFDISKTYTNVPSTARIEAQIFSLEPYIKGYYPTYNLAIPSGHSNGFYWKYNNNKPYNGMMPIIVITNFSAELWVEIYDPVELQWYAVKACYRTDIGSNDLWLEFYKANPQYPLPMSGVPVINPANPYPNIPDTKPEGGEGSGDFNGDTISEPSLPSKSAMGSGLVQLYNPTVSQLRSFGQWLWNTNGFDLNDLKRVFNDPMDMIIGLSIFPVTPTVSDSPGTIKLGNIDSEVSSNVLSSQFKRIDLGTINLEEVYNSYLDYAPYTKVQIFLPFIGIRDLDCDDVMGKAIHLTYSIDMLSGACVAHVLVNGSTMYEYGGSCNEQVPLTARDLTTIFSGIASVVATGAGAVAAISAGIAALPAEASAGAVLGTAGVGVTGAGASIARNVISSKPSVEHGSGIGGTTGYLSSKKPYLIVQRPRLCHPANQEHFTGYPGFIYVSALSQLEGFTKMVNVELTRIHATDAELEEIAEWLMSKGVRI